MKISRFIAGSLLTVGAPLSAVHLTNNIELSGGYRQDDFKTAYDYFLIDTPESVTYNSTQSRHANIWQLGLKGRLVMPELCCFQEYDFLRNFYVKGFAYWGSDVGKTHFSDLYFGYDEGFACGILKTYHTVDWQIAGGYLFDLGCLCGYGSDLDLSLGLLGGYAWDKQKISIRNNHVGSYFDGEGYFPDEAYNHGKLFNKWQGGFIGTELYYSACDFLLNFGYEYHWATFNGGEDLPNWDFYDRRHSDNASGNVVYLDASYQVCDGWEVGAELKWERYSANHGKTRASDDDAYQYAHTNAQWQSWQLTANVGYNF